MIRLDTPERIERAYMRGIITQHERWYCLIFLEIARRYNA